ncbi:hypothetical protein HYH03_004402 [Edaphochlamys debaryana]|uniref:Uncharacterized protein n=1 Tax=Edaphochlamys debaryana TaxID=47281 RepID=A0A835YAC7_9CHLO|nr:hypothetical protein HYH03_004402 [Edaphochlamys debaryana]|eukprot:KAG2497663.1 hypothetical protein HYH03_004402 [Edaphochlamys debaryana]
MRFPRFVSSGKYAELENRAANAEQLAQSLAEEKQRRIEAEERANKEANLARLRVLAGTILTCGLLFLLSWALFGPGAAAALGFR